MYKHKFAVSICLGIAAFLIFVSCGNDSKNDTAPVLTLQTNPVASTKGSQFVSVEASGQWTLSITYPASSGTEKDEWASLSTESGSDSKSGIVLTYSENADTSKRSLVLTLISGSKYSDVELVQAGTAPSGNTGGNEPATDWLELPAMSTSDSYGFFTHYMKIGTVSTRNYSFCWDYSNYDSKWVAYPLNAWNIGSAVSRTDNWGLDPLLPRDKQPVLFSGFKDGNNGWYARGHQLPSADRLSSREANTMTFYFTNMTPQIQNGFNGSIWANLESEVRSWANKSDTLYVVTGCVADGSIYYALDNDGKKIPVPVGYYKAVLRYSKASTIGFSGYMGCAIYLDHKAYSNSSITASMFMSIDDLEKKTGLDLFVNLPDKIGKENAAKVEAQNPVDVSWWW
ncbi:MAG: DNA/RNA non-specific endonuclease [Bacteroidales bacterium]|jgi:endonuclease G|nr:DNA/RNA non-specific endonuclease [Bacteroidales bacterium]MCI1784672.1 DNA/RNA non-specific endonuclease [Bacteroidales bacterium]